MSQKTGLPLFHNHLTVDLVKTLFEFGTTHFIKLREEIWLSSFTEATKANQSFIFTLQPEAIVALELIERFRRIIESTDGSVHFVELYCTKSEVLKRLENDSRGNFGKLQNVDLYKQIDKQGGFDFPPLPEALITIDTENLSPEGGQARTEDPFRSDQNRRNQLSKQTEHVFCQPNRFPKWGIERQQQTDPHGCPVNFDQNRRNLFLNKQTLTDVPVARSAISVKPYPPRNGPYSI